MISYFLYGVFLQDGMAALVPVLQALAGLFTQNWAAVGPTQKKEKHAENGVGSTDANLEYADIDFIVNDYMTVRAGN